MPVRGLVGTDYTRVRPDFKVIADPFTGEDVVVVPPITPDVALIHAFTADTDGNVLVDRMEDDHLLAQASRRVIVTVEDIVSSAGDSDNTPLQETPAGLFVSGIYITAIVHAPQGAYPTGCRGLYDHDAAHIRRYLQLSKTPEGFHSYLEAEVLQEMVRP